MNSTIRYFDLLSKIRTVGTIAVSRSGKKQMQLPQYIFLVLGILTQPFFAHYQATGHWDWTGFSGRLLFSFIAGVVIFPGIYKNAFDPRQPLFPQLCMIFSAGMGWESLLRTSLQAAGSMAGAGPAP